MVMEFDEDVLLHSENVKNIYEFDEAIKNQYSIDRESTQ